MHIIMARENGFAVLVFTLVLGGFVADEPVSGEPVSEARFPANREKNREFRENCRNFEFLVA
jgi:hypothetical protein